jgi:hypothetical protein
MEEEGGKERKKEISHWAGAGQNEDRQERKTETKTSCGMQNTPLDLTLPREKFCVCPADWVGRVWIC